MLASHLYYLHYSSCMFLRFRQVLKMLNFVKIEFQQASMQFLKHIFDQLIDFIRFSFSEYKYYYSYQTLF